MTWYLKCVLIVLKDIITEGTGGLVKFIHLSFHFKKTLTIIRIFIKAH